MSRSTWVAYAVTIIALFAAVIWTPPAVSTASLGQPVTMTEDDPRWVCTIMGNRLCGPRG